ncbi:TetR/AcrR family transcriptional regulator [Lactiplantibacillus pentosus]|uniref:TetR/AcrR family transcriptional regulator n=1 Tax=Lactiplantibacillus pentosus TaxID=1589 RepID=A0AB37RG56_LACPE|nr:TetR/AcrR family transcriptional regulator [Lactiplantibacillus pentosus]RMW46767.1 TetR/AcrR family transcriptional regulator [Lactiplantibacillus pentosus]RMW47438.1 TetR/AcrR family transcriptional regulator [Lactiplantibacillus pentosus]RMW54347.1 TetR/AcrR family transcriptional regulator [Lactiplantibacillus pentosus]RMW56063.1 TetR/AcrR family transcriptional regulator [Lactiplantibacillus pentosus]
MSEIETIQAYYAASLGKDGRITRTQRLILAAALDLFAEKGYEEVGTREIAERAGVAEGTIFHNFVNKNGILDAIMQPIVKNILPTMLNTLDQAVLDSPNQTLEAFIVALVRDRVKFVTRNRASLAVILSQFFNNAEDRAAVLGMVSPAILAQATEAMERLKATGELVEWPNHMILQLVFSTIGGYLVEQVLYPQAATLSDQQVVHYLSDFLVNGLSPRRIPLQSDNTAS